MNETDLTSEQHWRAAMKQAPAEIQNALNPMLAEFLAHKKSLKALQAEKKRYSAGFKDALPEEQAERKQALARVGKLIKERQQQLLDLRSAAAEQLTGSDELQAEPVSPLQKQYPAQESTAQRVVPFSEAMVAEWDAYVDAHPGSTFCHRCSLGQTAAELLGQQFHGFVALNDRQKIVGVLPMIALQSRLFGHYLVSMPWFNYGGPLGDSADVERALLDAASTLLQPGVAHIELRELQPRESLPQRTDKVSMLLPLPDNIDAFWQSLGSKLRAQIKRPQAEATSCRSGGAELVPDFYKVFAENMRDLGTPVYARAFFSGLLQAFPDNFSVHVVYLSGQPAAGAILLRHGPLIEIPWASSLRKHNGISINMLLYWHCLSYSITAGSRWFDFGRSSRDATTYRFKKQWGAQPVSHYWHYLLPEGAEMPALNPDNPKFKLLIAVWRKLPVWVTRIVGPHVVRNLP